MTQQFTNVMSVGATGCPVAVKVFAGTSSDSDQEGACNTEQRARLSDDVVIAIIVVCTVLVSILCASIGVLSMVNER